MRVSPITLQKVRHKHKVGYCNLGQTCTNCSRSKLHSIDIINISKLFSIKLERPRWRILDCPKRELERPQWRILDCPKGGVCPHPTLCICQCVGMQPFSNSSELFTTSCSHKNFMIISLQAIQQLTRWQTSRHPQNNENNRRPRKAVLSLDRDVFKPTTHHASVHHLSTVSFSNRRRIGYFEFSLRCMIVWLETSGSVNPAWLARIRYSSLSWQAQRAYIYVY